MIIKRFSVQKMDPSDPRYPTDLVAERVSRGLPPLSEVYRIVCEMEDGQAFEAPFCRFEGGDPLTPQKVSEVLKLFASAVSRLEQAAEAA